MKFQYIPFFTQMIELYQNPRTYEGRFENYLKLIRGIEGNDMERPLAFFNPMANDHVLDKLIKMRNEGFEELLEQNCKQFSKGGEQIQMYFNLADDICGGWTTIESTNELSLKIGPFLKRKLGVILFFASEDITPQLIKERVEFYTNYYQNYNL